MRVYTRVVIDLNSGRFVSCAGYDYRGPVARCKGGGGTTLDSVDETYNAGMLELSEKQWAVAEQYVNLFKHGVTYDPNAVQQGAYIDGEWVEADKLSGYSDDYHIENPEWKEWNKWNQSYLSKSEDGKFPGYDWWQKNNPEPEKYILNPDRLEERTLGDIHGFDPDAQVSEMELILQGQSAQAELLPLQTALAKSQIAADQALIPAQTGLSLDQISKERGILSARYGLERSEIADRQKAIDDFAPVRSAFYNEALKGPDADQRADEAQAGVEHAFSLTQKDFERDLFTSGAQPGGVTMARALNDRSLAKAGAVAGVRTQARRLAEDELFSKLKSATAMGSKQ